MPVVLVNPQTKKPTGFEPHPDTPRYFDGPHQNVAEVTEEWQANELQRVYAVAAERERCGK